MIVYVTVNEDSLSGAEIELFDTPEKAIARAQQIIQANLETAKLMEPHLTVMDPSTMVAAGLLCWYRYSQDGGRVWVKAMEVR